MISSTRNRIYSLTSSCCFSTFTPCSQSVRSPSFLFVLLPSCLFSFLFVLIFRLFLFPFLFVSLLLISNNYHWLIDWFITAILKVPAHQVCEYDPCSGKTCQDRPNARCLVTSKCRPIYVNAFNEIIKKCEG